MLLNRKLLGAISAVLVALGGLSSHAFAASVNGNAQAVVIAPLSISETQGLNFGSFAPAAGATTVVVTTAGAVSSAAADLIAGSGAQAGGFDVSGEAGYAFTVTMPVSATLTSGANSMTITAWSTATGSTGAGTAGTLDGTGADTVQVGGTLSVGGGQAAGTYTGTYAVTVDYN